MWLVEVQNEKHTTGSQCLSKPFERFAERNVVKGCDSRDAVEGRNRQGDAAQVRLAIPEIRNASRADPGAPQHLRREVDRHDVVEVLREGASEGARSAADFKRPRPLVGRWRKRKL